MTRQTGSFNAASVSREFQTTFLLCDCNLLWLLRWVKERSIAVKSTKCSYPQALQGQPFTSRPEVFTCGMAWARPARRAASLTPSVEAKLCVLLQPVVEQQQQIRGRLLRTLLLVCRRSRLISSASITASSCTFKLTCHSGRDPPPNPNGTQT